MKASDLKADQGITGDIDGRPVAIFGQDKQVTVLENICTHRGCQTAWNDDERTWDCPCHGSRYNADGTVLRGPARAPLKTLGHTVADGEVKLT